MRFGLPAEEIEQGTKDLRSIVDSGTLFGSVTRWGSFFFLSRHHPARRVSLLAFFLLF